MRNANEELDWLKYQEQARIITDVFKNGWFGRYDGKKLHCDHKYSIYQGWRRGVPLDVISGRGNLRLIPAWENLSKGTWCCVSLERLYAFADDDPLVKRLADYLQQLDYVQVVEFGEKVTRKGGKVLLNTILFYDHHPQTPSNPE